MDFLRASRLVQILRVRAGWAETCQQREVGKAKERLQLTVKELFKLESFLPEKKKNSLREFIQGQNMCL